MTIIMFSRFDTVPACDGRTDRETDRRTDVQPISITCFSIADARKNALHGAKALSSFSNEWSKFIAVRVSTLQSSPGDLSTR